MSNFAKPSLKELRNRAISNINTYLQGADANLRRRILNIFATIFAAMGDEVLRRVDYLLKQLFIQTADEEYLIKHGQTKRFPRKMPSKAEGPASFPATAGSVIPAGTKIKRADNVTYSTKAERTAGADGTVTLELIADNAGKDGNATAGTILSLVSPVAGVTTQGSVGNLGITFIVRVNGIGTAGYRLPTLGKNRFFLSRITITAIEVEMGRYQGNPRIVSIFSQHCTKQRMLVFSILPMLNGCTVIPSEGSGRRRRRRNQSHPDQCRRSRRL